jgi:hypothetical protein
MKRLLFLSAFAVVATSAWGQRAMHGHIPSHTRGTATAAKPTATGDTVTISNIANTDTARLLYTHPAPASGYTTGTNSYNDKGFAEKYRFGTNAVKVIGFATQFSGAVNPASTKSIVLKVWSQGSESMITARSYYQGFPSSVTDSLSVPVTQLGIGTTKDTIKRFMLAAPSAFRTGNFFVGYTFNYNYAELNGDTIALATSTDGKRTSANYTLRYNTSGSDTVSVDTIINVQNATQWADNIWHDNYTDNDSLYNNLAIFPIVILGDPTGMEGVTHRQLTLYGTYPNPSSADCNLRFSLASSVSVSISVTDMAGRIVLPGITTTLSAGMQIVPMNTYALPSGDYIYTISTSAGDRIGGKFTIIQ